MKRIHASKRKHGVLGFIAWAIALSISVLVLLAFFILSGQPAVESDVTLSHQHILHVRQLLRNHLGTQSENSPSANIQFGEQDLHVIVNYLLQRSSTGSAKITIADQRLQADASFPVADLGHYINLHFQLKTRAGKPEIEQFTIGQLSLPAIFGHGLALWGLHQFLEANPDQQIQSVQIRENRLTLQYRPDPAFLQRIRQQIFRLGDPSALLAYADKLLELQQQAVGRQRQLNPLLQALFGYALKRAQPNKAARENAALLTVLGLWAGKQKLADYIPGLVREPAKFNLKLQRRIDTARHFLLSAALAARGDNRLARAIGLSKELADAQTRSGFSFVDIAANEAGIAFGLLATQSQSTAHALQNVMSQTFADADIMPAIPDLPENIPHAAFQQRFGGIDQPVFEAMMARIRQRVLDSRLYQHQ